MAENIIQMTVNTDTRKAVESETLNTLQVNDILRLIYGERPIIGATFVNKNGTPISFSPADTFELNVDVDFAHNKYPGTLNNAYSGAVSTIVATFENDLTGLIRSEGRLTLKSLSNPNLRESVEYTNAIISGTDITFTVSKTLVNSYDAADFCAIQDRMMAQATEDDVNTGEWSEADKTAGKISFRLDCREATFQEKLRSLDPDGEILEFRVKSEIRRYPTGEVIPIILMQDDIYARQTVRDLEEVTIPSNENWTEADARYVKIGEAGGFFVTAGVSGGQSASGGTDPGDDLTLNSTTDATKGAVILQDAGGDVVLGSANGAKFDGTNNRFSVGVGTETELTIGGATIGSTISAHAEGGTDLAEHLIHRHSDTAGFGAHSVFARSRGTEAAKTSVQDGDYLARIDGVGHDGTDYEVGAQIDMIVDGVPGPGDMPGAIVIMTTPPGSATPVERMRIDSAGNVMINTATPIAGIALNIDGSIKHKTSRATAYVTTAAATPTITAGTPVNLLTNSTIASGNISPDEFTIDNANKRLVYTGVATKIFDVFATMSTVSSASNVILKGFVYKNGSLIASSEQERKIGTGSDIGNWSVHEKVELATNDYVEIFVDLATSTGTVTPSFCVFHADEI